MHIYRLQIKMIKVKCVYFDLSAAEQVRNVLIISRTMYIIKLGW